VSAAVRRPLRSARALGAGFLAIVALSLATDELFHRLDVYPPWGEPMRETGDNLLALGYRCVYGVLGSWIAARLAPYAPMRHAVGLGWIGLPFAVLGVIAALRLDLGPVWYPVALLLTVLPCAWLGGALHGGERAEATAEA
jgi:hypothetical protein